ncbi:MAG: RecX family transcriptional regulator [Phycisphaeraceae bacterium]|nr:RecX family transcriptional regulator [Phycisphaeraceae bacterium]
MPTVTALRPTKRDPDRVSVHVDGRALAVLHTHSIHELRLTVGCPCDPQLIQQAAGVDQAMKQSLNRLGRRALSSGQLDRKLKELGHDEVTRQAALERLTNAGLLDDRVFAETLVRQIKRRKPAGAALLQQKLREKFLDAELIEQVIAEQSDRATDVEQATALARQRQNQLQRVEPMACRRRIYGLLARRGFDPQTISDVMARLKFSDDGDSGEDSDKP